MLPGPSTELGLAPALRSASAASTRCKRSAACSAMLSCGKAVRRRGGSAAATSGGRAASRAGAWSDSCVTHGRGQRSSVESRGGRGAAARTVQHGPQLSKGSHHEAASWAAGRPVAGATSTRSCLLLGCSCHGCLLQAAPASTHKLAHLLGLIHIHQRGQQLDAPGAVANHGSVQRAAPRHAARRKLRVAAAGSHSAAAPLHPQGSFEGGLVAAQAGHQHVQGRGGGRRLRALPLALPARRPAAHRRASDGCLMGGRTCEGRITWWQGRQDGGSVGGGMVVRRAAPAAAAVARQRPGGLAAQSLLWAPGASGWGRGVPQSAAGACLPRAGGELE